MSRITSSGWEFVFSGFEPSFMENIRFSSSRPTTTYFLPLVGPQERRQYDPLREALTDEYRRKAAPFPVYIYEVVKSSPGLLGRWLELATGAGSALPAALSDLRRDVPWYKCIEGNAPELVRLAEQYLADWAAGPCSPRVEAAIQKMAEHPAPLAIATRDKECVPHAFPFAVLSDVLDTKHKGLLRYVRCAHSAVRAYCGSSKAHSPDSGGAPTPETRGNAGVAANGPPRPDPVRKAARGPTSQVASMTKGRLLETVVCTAMAMKFAAMGSVAHKFEECIAAWLGPSCAGSIPKDLMVKARSDTWTQDPDEARKAEDEVNRFPCAGRKGGKQAALRKNERDQMPLAQRAVVHPRHPQNEGCDVVGVLDTEDSNGVVLLLLNCKYTAIKEFNERFSHKAQLALEGIAGLLEATKRKQRVVLGGKKVVHVAFGMALMGRHLVDAEGNEDLPYDKYFATATGLNTVIERLASCAITVSLHVCRGAEDLQRLLTPPLYHVIPDNEWHDAPTNAGVSCAVNDRTCKSKKERNRSKEFQSKDN